MRWRGVLLALAAAWALPLVGCGSSPSEQVVALSDELARSCGEVGSKMVEGWRRVESTRLEGVPYPADELADLEETRARCQGGLRLLEEIVHKRRPVSRALEEGLQDLLVLDRLLLRSVVEPDMDREALAATVACFEDSYGSLRSQIAGKLPLTLSQEQAMVGGLLDRWRKLTPKWAGALP